MNDSVLAILNHYCEVLIKVKGKSKHTVRAYRNDITDFVEFCENRETDPLHLDNTVIRTYFSVLKMKVAATTLSRRIAALRGFYGYLKDEGVVDVNPWASVRGPKLPKNLPEFLSETEAATLVETPKDDTVMGKRDRAILEVLYGCGLRVAELTGMDAGDADLNRGMLSVKGKGSKYRVVPLGEPAAQAIAEWLKVRGTLLKDPQERAMFLNRFGGRLSTRSVRRLLDKYGIVAGVPKHVHPHILRHSYATHMLSGGADLKSIQELLGHSRISTTQKYTHLTLSGLRRVYRSTHPRARKKQEEKE